QDLVSTSSYYAKRLDETQHGLMSAKTDYVKEQQGTLYLNMKLSFT
ncbi:Uncharacterized protein APZ42_003048, partial [Daphnia magna]